MTTSQEAALARQAAKRGGVFTRAQAGRLGIAPSTLDRRLRSGVLMERHPGVLQAATSPYDPEAQEWAALLAAGPGAMLSHPSAGALWLPEVVERPSLPWVTIPFAARYRRLQGVEVVRSRHLEGVLRWHQGRPVTAPARTWVDLGRVLTDEALGSALAAGLQRRHFTLGDVERVLSVAHHRAGTQAVRRVLPQYRPEWESYLSALFGRLQEEAGLGLIPQFEVRDHHGLLVALADFGDPRAQLLVEVDGWAYHGSKEQQARDRRRDRLTLSLGWTTMRFPGQEVHQRAAACVAEVAAVQQRLLRAA